MESSLNNNKTPKFLNLFYDFENLQDCLIAKISGSERLTKKVQKNNAILFLDSEDTLLGFNLIHASKLNLNLKKGINFPSKKLLTEIAKIIEIDLSTYSDLVPFVVGQIKRFKKINNTNLNYCEVDVGKNELQKIICGATNLAINLNVVVVLPGGIIPLGKEIFASKVFGYNSDGMICSAKELGLKQTTEGKVILELTNERKPGDLFLEVYNLSDN